MTVCCNFFFLVLEVYKLGVLRQFELKFCTQKMDENLHVFFGYLLLECK